MDWHELEKMKVTDLRELAKEKTQLEGLSGLHKDQLVEAIAHDLGIEKPHKVVHGAQKTKIKQAIRAAKARRGEAEASKNRAAYTEARLELRKLRRRLRRMAQVEG
jgi:hypothetical protein